MEKGCSALRKDAQPPGGMLSPEGPRVLSTEVGGCLAPQRDVQHPGRMASLPQHHGPGGLMTQ